METPLPYTHTKLTEVLLFNLENAKDCAYQQTSFASCFHWLRQHCSQPCSARSPSPSRIRRKWQSARAGRRKRDKRQDWHAPRCLRTGHETLLRLVPTQGKQNFLAFGRGSQGGFPDELPIRLKKNRYEELLRAGYSFEHQEGLHFQAMICAVHFQRELLSRASGSDLALLENRAGQPSCKYRQSGPPRSPERPR